LYQRLWKGRKLTTDEFVLSADEKTSIQARCRKAASLPAQPGQPMKVEHEYERLGAWAYLAALDVHQAKLFVAAKPKPESPPLIAWSIKSCNSIPIAGREAFSGSSTTVLRIEVPGQSKGSRASIPTWCSFRARPCQLAQSNRNLFLDHPTKGPDAQRFSSRQEL